MATSPTGDMAERCWGLGSDCSYNNHSGTTASELSQLAWELEEEINATCDCMARMVDFMVYDPNDGHMYECHVCTACHGDDAIVEAVRQQGAELVSVGWVPEHLRGQDFLLMLRNGQAS